MLGRISFAALWLVCAATSAQAQTLEKPNITLAVGGKTLVAFLPLTIAERRGLFESEGLKVEINDFQGGSRALQSLVARTISRSSRSRSSASAPARPR
jgi:NitT/TauT family transport system substrate-binding protein